VTVPTLSPRFSVRAKRFVRYALVVSPPFLVAIGALVLSLAGVVDLDPRILERDVLILNLLTYWAVATLMLAAICNAAAVGHALRQRLIPLSIASVALLLSLAVAELVARIIVERTHGFELEYSAELHHKSPSNVSMRDNTGASIRTNADGLRTHQTRDSFRQHHQRIAVMGDSFVFGLGVDDDKAVPQQLESLLRERRPGSDVGVLNAGVISYSPLLERSAFREVVRSYSPTLTVLLLDLGDIGDDFDYAADIVPGSDPQAPRFQVGAWTSGSRLALLKLADPLLEPLREPVVLMRRLANRPHRPTSYLDFEVTVGGVIERDRWFILRHPLADTRPYFIATLSYIEDLARDARESGSEFVLVVVPRYFQWSDRECPNDWAKARQTALGPHRYANFEFFTQAQQQVDFSIVSLLPAFQATERFPLVFDHDAHWNEAGTRFVAETLADILIERGLVR